MSASHDWIAGFEAGQESYKADLKNAERARDKALAALREIENATGLSPIQWTQGDILQAVMARARRALDDGGKP